MEIDNTHTLQVNGHGTECKNCWGCSCHSSDILAKICDYSVAIESSIPQVVRALEQQAARYGAQIRQLQINGMETDLLRIRQAWSRFLRQLTQPYLARISSTAYHAEYYK